MGTWAVMLAAAGGLAGRTGLGTLLTVAFILQVTPSIWTAYRTARPSGISRGTWLLILGELSCWLAFGLHKSDPRLITLGTTGVTASALMLARIRHAGNNRRRTCYPARGLNKAGDASIGTAGHRPAVTRSSGNRRSARRCWPACVTSRRARTDVWRFGAVWPGAAGEGRTVNRSRCTGRAIG